jgi:hypothetical protein
VLIDVRCLLLEANFIHVRIKSPANERDAGRYSDRRSSTECRYERISQYSQYTVKMVPIL